MKPISELSAHIGGGQDGATLITSDFTVVKTVATAGDSVLLPKYEKKKRVYIANLATLPCDLFPQLGDAIAPLNVNVAVSVLPNNVIVLEAAEDKTWKQLS